MITRSVRILSQVLSKSRSNAKMLQQVRHSSHELAFHYREIAPKSPRYTFIYADGINAFMWWWIFIHCYYQFGHIVGEYDIPDPEKFTDAELGITDEF